ncbi:MAG TPA: BTAD domain-containing putative transcriptional regulator, partial [Acidimicrobiia bacterium]
MRIRVLGQVAAVDGAGEIVRIGSRSQRIVLATLAAAGGDTVGADRLIDALWGDDPPRTAEHSLRTYVSRLRRTLGDAIAIRPAGYALALDTNDVDALRFEKLVRDGTAATGDRALPLLDEALELWGGAPFGDVADTGPLLGAAVRLGELHSAARERRAAVLLAAGHVAEAVAAAEQLLADEPLREGTWAVLVEALARAGRAAEALRAYQRAASALTGAGLEPSPRLRQAEALALEGAPAEVEASDRGRPLPTPATSLVGRDRDLDGLEHLLGSARVVTLTGPGGVGKTRLALEVARRIASSSDTEVRWVELAKVDDPASVASAIADALALAIENEAPLDALGRIGGLELLVVLDNCEHVVDEAAAVTEVIVTGGDHARVLATSRERLGVDGEYTWAVAPLELTGPDAPAHRLLTERIRAIRPTLALDESDRPILDRIARRLDGLPLAIEMAAARVATLPLDEIADRLDDQLDLLHGSRRNRVPRHRTLTAVVEWSEALLDDEERALFADLSVFAGPVAADDVSAVTGRPAALDTLCRLADRSLVVSDIDGTRARFGMLETIRDHARTRLAASGRARGLASRHAEHFVAAAEAADHDLRTPHERDAAHRFDELLPELRAAHRWARTDDLDLAVRLSAALHLFAQSRLRDEIGQWATFVAPELLAAGIEGDLAAIVLASAAQRCVSIGDLASASALAERGIAAARNSAARAYPLEQLGDIRTFEGRLDDAAAAGRELVAIGNESADPHVLVTGVIGVSLPEAYAGRHGEAERVLSSCGLDHRALSPSDRAWLSYAEGEIVLDRDPQRALAALGRAIELADSVGNRYVGGVARVSDCSLRARAGDVAGALDAFGSVIRHWRRCGATIHQLTTLRNLVVLLQRVGAAHEVAELLGAVRSLELRPTYGDEAARLDASEAWV